MDINTANQFISFPITIPKEVGNKSYEFDLSQYFEKIKNMSVVTSSEIGIVNVCTIEELSVDGIDYLVDFPLEMTLHSPHANTGQRGFNFPLGGITIATKQSKLKIKLSNSGVAEFMGKLIFEYDAPRKTET